ncbi:hypothetical protein ILYODFUR_000035 [Ilyodon furcidens]|uniref:Uncharacterized protein n=1 Tax=Ilyodon furcidens TaxID=33524 RepID=A0ABV0U5P3_9TELE
MEGFLRSSFLLSRVMSSKQATSPFASVVDGDDAMSQEHLSWEKDESADAHGTPQLPLHSLLHGKAPDEMQPLSSVPPESDWDSLVSAQQRMTKKISGRKTAEDKMSKTDEGKLESCNKRMRKGERKA